MLLILGITRQAAGCCIYDAQRGQVMKLTVDELVLIGLGLIMMLGVACFTPEGGLRPVRFLLAAIGAGLAAAGIAGTIETTFNLDVGLGSVQGKAISGLAVFIVVLTVMWKWDQADRIAD